MNGLKNIVSELIHDALDFTGIEQDLVCFLIDQIDDECITSSFSVPFDEINEFLGRERLWEDKEMQDLLVSTIEKMMHLRMNVNWGFAKIYINVMSSALCDMTERKVFFRFNQDILDTGKEHIN